MTRLAALQSLRDKLAAADGPSKELSRELQCTIGGWKRIPPKKAGKRHPMFLEPGDGHLPLEAVTEWCRDVPHCTASLDAAAALVERVLPEHVWSVNNSGGAILTGRPELRETFSIYTLRLPALALCRALVEALIAQEEHR